jgi:integrase
MLAAWCQLRRGEILGLQRLDIDQQHRTLTIHRAVVVDGSTGRVIVDKPKTAAGSRTITMPANVATAVAKAS